MFRESSCQNNKNNVLDHGGYLVARGHRSEIQPVKSFETVKTFKVCIFTTKKKSYRFPYMEKKSYRSPYGISLPPIACRVESLIKELGEMLFGVGSERPIHFWIAISSHNLSKLELSNASKQKHQLDKPTPTLN